MRGICRDTCPVPRPGMSVVPAGVEPVVLSTLKSDLCLSDFSLDLCLSPLLDFFLCLVSDFQHLCFCPPCGDFFLLCLVSAPLFLSTSSAGSRTGSVCRAVGFMKGVSETTTSYHVCQRLPGYVHKIFNQTLYFQQYIQENIQYMFCENHDTNLHAKQKQKVHMLVHVQQTSRDTIWRINRG